MHDKEYCGTPLPFKPVAYVRNCCRPSLTSLASTKDERSAWHIDKGAFLLAASRYLRWKRPVEWWTGWSRGQDLLQRPPTVLFDAPHFPAGHEKAKHVHTNWDSWHDD